MTEPGGVHIDENFAPDRRGDVDVVEVEATTERVDDQRLHAASLQSGSKLAVLTSVKWSLLISPRYLYDQTNSGKVSKWNCDICAISWRSVRSSITVARRDDCAWHSQRCPARFRIP